MIALSLSTIAEIVGGTVHGDPDLVVDGAAYVDSRVPVPGGLFVAIAGERVDGHEYAEGAHAVLGSRPTTAPTVVVPDATVALGRLARHVVDRLDAPVLAMTGSQGKTGTKDYLAHVLAAVGSPDSPDSPGSPGSPGSGVVATAGNLNNELGVPLTVLRADERTTHLVVEMGARGIGHLGYLCEIAPPQVAAVLNVGTAHLGEFGSREAIAQAKGELVEALEPDGTAVLNADDPLVAAMRSRTRATVTTFGDGGSVVPGGQVAWREVSLDDLGRPSFELGSERLGWHRVALRQTGRHQVANAAAAATMALAVGVDLAAAAAALSTARPASRWRMEVSERADGTVVLNDAYNANPASTVAALATLAEIGRRRARRTVAVLGEMRELGGEHDAGHREVGRAAADLGVDVLVVVGDAAAGLGEGAGSAPGWAGETVLTASRDHALAWVRENVGAGDVVLVKASRAAELEHLAAALLADQTPHQPDRPTGPTTPTTPTTRGDAPTP